MPELPVRLRHVHRLNDRNLAALDMIAERLAEWQEVKQDGKILIHVNSGGVAHKIEPTPSIIVSR